MYINSYNTSYILKFKNTSGVCIIRLLISVTRCSSHSKRSIDVEECRRRRGERAIEHPCETRERRPVKAVERDEVQLGDKWLYRVII